MTEPLPGSPAAPIGSLLAATDLSDAAQRVVRRAAALAARLGARLDLVHVADGADPHAASAATQALRELADQTGRDAGIAVGAAVQTGDAADAVVEAALAASMLVIGATRRSALQRMVLGSTAERLMRRSLRPVLVVKRPTDQPYRQVLVPVDLSAYSPPALALALAIAPDAHVTVMHASGATDAASVRAGGLSAGTQRNLDGDAQARAMVSLGELLDALPAADRARVTGSVVQGEPADAALANAAACNADLMVVGKHQRGAIEELLLGSVTNQLLAQADCDLLVVTGATRAAVDARALPPAYS